MPIAKRYNGHLLLTGTYARIYPHVDDDMLRTSRWTEGDIFLHELTAGDEIQIKYLKYDPEGAIHRSYATVIKQGIQTDPCFHIHALMDLWFRIEVRQTLSPESFKTINFDFWEVTD